MNSFTKDKSTEEKLKQKKNLQKTKYFLYKRKYTKDLLAYKSI